jgi:hypothetical protein
MPLTYEKGLESETNDPLADGGIAVRRLIRLLRQTELHVFLFVLGFTSLNWPFLRIFHGESPVGLFLYLFLIWFLMIVMLFLIDRACRVDASQSPEHGPY